jgi:hypothetical protein
MTSTSISTQHLHRLPFLDLSILVSALGISVLDAVVYCSALLLVILFVSVVCHTFSVFLPPSSFLLSAIVSFILVVLLSPSFSNFHIHISFVVLSTSHVLLLSLTAVLSFSHWPPWTTSFLTTQLVPLLKPTFRFSPSLSTKTHSTLSGVCSDSTHNGTGADCWPFCPPGGQYLWVYNRAVGENIPSQLSLFVRELWPDVGFKILESSFN